MELRTIKITSIQPPADNPRRSFKKDSLEGLADSIKTDGLLQNLVVTPTKGKKYRIISGERRYRALQLLLKNGDITQDYEVPVEIRTKLSKEETLRLATIENVQRENLPPMDEAEAFASLLKQGASIDDLEAKTGVSVSTIKRRLALADLSKPVKKSLRDGLITLSIAEALTLYGTDDQKDIIKDFQSERTYTATQLRRNIDQKKPSVSIARFPLEQYTGELNKDLFADEETTYFMDIEQFMKLQTEAVDMLAKEYARKSDWVQVVVEPHINLWQYGRADKKAGECGGVVIHLAPSGKVSIHEGLTKRTKVDPKATDTEKKPKPVYSKRLCKHMAFHKTIVVQQELLNNPRKVKVLAVLNLIDNDHAHSALSYFEDEPEQPISYIHVAAEAKAMLKKLALDTDPEAQAWDTLKNDEFASDTDLYDAVDLLTDKDLDRLHALLTVLEFGQLNCETLDTSTNSLFNHVAQDINVNMAKHWKPDAEFLNLRNREQLIKVATESGYPNCIHLTKFNKTKLVTVLHKHFVDSEPNWIPEAMQFPAIDPQQQEQEEVDSLPETA